MLEIINRYGTDLKLAASKMIEHANQNGGPDNITVILARYIEDGS
jgi:serine/threonine protein phosphatase PrpC